jgi:hypothetical protein
MVNKTFIYLLREEAMSPGGLSPDVRVMGR